MSEVLVEGLPLPQRTETHNPSRTVWDGEVGVYVSTLPVEILAYRYAFDFICIGNPPPPGGGSVLLGGVDAVLHKMSYPYHTSVLLSYRYPERLPYTWKDALPIQLPPATKAEVEAINGYTDERTPLCGGDPRVAREANLTYLQQWKNLWGRGDSAPNPLQLYGMLDLADQSAETQVVCWEYLCQILMSKDHSNRYWLECYRTAHKARERVFKFKSYPIKSVTTMIHLYAYMRTAVS